MVVYLHGNSSCRAGCLDSLEVVLGVGATMFALDFAGSGKSGGEYVTLGEYEKDDVAAVRVLVSGNPPPLPLSPFLPSPPPQVVSPAYSGSTPPRPTPKPLSPVKWWHRGLVLLFLVFFSGD